MEKLGREQVDPSFRIWPDRPDNEQCHTIFYLEPADGPNRRAVGYDMYIEPVRAAAMDAARDNAAPVASGKVELVQDAGDPRGRGLPDLFAAVQGQAGPGVGRGPPREVVRLRLRPVPGGRAAGRRPPP